MQGGVGRRLLAISCAGTLAAAAISGCGDDGDKGDAASGDLRVAVANEPENVFVERLAKLLETTTSKRDCLELEQINARSDTRFSCPPGAALRRSMKRFRVVGSRAYGTGAVVDYESARNRDGAAVVLYVAPDREWGVARFGVLTDPSTNTSDAGSRDGYREAVEEYVQAVRSRDCAAFREAAYVEGGSVCERQFAATAPLARRLKAEPEAKPRYLGGNSTYGFFSLETRRPEPENTTISVVRDEDGGPGAYVVLHVAPSPTTADQRRIEREYRRQMRR